MLKVLCVLKSGGEFRKSHVSALHDGFREHLKTPFQFLCLNDLDADGPFSVPLKHGWPKWWSKIELFSRDWNGPVIYADLDTIPVGPLDSLVEGHDFTMLRNFWRPERVGSGLMAWNRDMTAIYKAFLKSPDRFMAEYSTADKWGDQVFIRDHSPVKPELWQDKFPCKVVSYKIHCRPGVEIHSTAVGVPRVPTGASVVCFHGLPRPWMTSLWPYGRWRAA